MMNKQSGLLAISGISNDAQVTSVRAPPRRSSAACSPSICSPTRPCSRPAPHRSAMGVDTITFTAGIGENDHRPRALRDCFEWLGVRIDNKNREAVGNGPQVSAAGSSVTVMVIPTDEEYMIAHDVERLDREQLTCTRLQLNRERLLSSSSGRPC